MWRQKLPASCRSVVIFCLMMYSVRTDSRFGSLSRLTILYSRVPAVLSMLADPSSPTACTTTIITPVIHRSNNCTKLLENFSLMMSCREIIKPARRSASRYVTHYVYGGRTCSIAFLRFEERVSFFWVSFAFCSLRPINMKRDTTSAISAARRTHTTALPTTLRDSFTDPLSPIIFRVADPSSNQIHPRCAALDDKLHQTCIAMWIMNLSTTVIF